MSSNYISLVLIFYMLEAVIDSLVLQIQPYCKRPKRYSPKRPWLSEEKIIQPNLAGLSQEIESFNRRNYEILLVEYSNGLHSSLIFYYTQIYPELFYLYEIIAGLLSCSQLIERIPEVSRIGTKPCESQSQVADPGRKLGRYSLIIMLATYLNSNAAQQIRLTSRNDQLLARHLIEFLKFFSGKGVKCVRPTLRNLCELELVSVNENEVNKVNLSDEGLKSEADELLVLDPLSGSTDIGQEKLLAALKRSNNLNELTNLTSGINSLPEIRILFLKLTAYLSKFAEAEGTVTSEKASSGFSFLIELLELAGCESRVQTYLKDEYIRGIDNQAIFCRASVLETGRKPSKWRNLIYFTIFLLAGNLLLNITEFLQDDIKKDLIVLKKASMFSDDNTETTTHSSGFLQKTPEQENDYDESPSFLSEMFDTTIQMDTLDPKESLLLEKFMQLRMDFDDESYEDDELEQNNNKFASVGKSEL